MALLVPSAAAPAPLIRNLLSGMMQRASPSLSKHLRDITIGFGLFLLLCGVGLWFSLPDAPSDRAFDAQLWRASSDNGQGRSLMVDDLLARHKLTGQRAQAVKALLGPPTHVDSTVPIRWNYIAGSAGDYSVDNAWLVVTLDSLGVVSEVGLEAD